jgi:lysophospholipase L1-like esterase
METHARRWLDEVLPETRRAALQESFENVLYRGRLYLLHLKPSTARSISGSRLLAAQSAVDSIATLCATNNVRLLLFHAPVNPNVTLYRMPEDRDAYHHFVAGVASRYGLPLFDFENSISAEHWGRLLNGPDPLHMGRAGQQEMAKLVIEALNSVQVNN